MSHGNITTIKLFVESPLLVPACGAETYCQVGEPDGLQQAGGGAAGCTAVPELCDQTTRLQRRMKNLEKERDGGGGKSDSKKEKDQVGDVCLTMNL